MKIAYPSISGIQRTNLIILLGLVALLTWRSAAAALSCALGGAIVIANFQLLAFLGRVFVAGASSGGSSAWAAIAIPLKMLLILGLVYLVFARTGVDGVGFGAGILTQFAAVLIETARASRQPGPALINESQESQT